MNQQIQKLRAFKTYLGLVDVPLDGVESRRELRSHVNDWTHLRISDFEDYKRMFCLGGLEGEFRIQKRPSSRWCSIPMSPNDKVLLYHLRGKHSVALRAGYYPPFAIIDIDNASSPQKEAEKWAERLHIDESQLLAFSSPSYLDRDADHIGAHLILKPRYKDRPLTKRLLHTILDAPISAGGAELFPSAYNAIRLPFGKNQYLFDRKGIKWDMKWYEALEEFRILPPVALEEMRFPHRYSEIERNLDWVPSVPSSLRNAEEILANGFKAGERHISQLKLSRYYYRLNYEQEQTNEAIKAFMRDMHKGRSKEINKGNWQKVDKDIEACVHDTYAYYEKSGFYPDTIHNMEGWITRKDIELGTALFPGMYINQKRFFKLALYYRPRQSMNLVPIHSWTWRKFADSRAVLEFMDFLEGKRRLDIDRHYDKIRGYPRRYRLALPSATKSEMLKDEEGRAIHDFKQALRATYGSIRDTVAATGISRHTLYEKVRVCENAQHNGSLAS